MGNRQPQRILLLGLPQSGKTTFSNYLSDNIVRTHHEPTTIDTTNITFSYRPLQLVEYGGNLVNKWKDIYSGEFDCVYLFVSSLCNELDVYATRNALFAMYFHCVTLRDVPLCVIQSCIDSTKYPTVSWETLKHHLQLHVNKKVVLVRVVYDESTALKKSIERILEWTFYLKRWRAS